MWVKRVIAQLNAVHSTLVGVDEAVWQLVAEPESLMKK
jgi:hypothetical protein